MKKCGWRRGACELLDLIRDVINVIILGADKLL